MSEPIREEGIAALTGARHADPFALLGMHAGAQGRLEIRAFLPGARVVEAIDATTGALAGELERHGNTDFFSTAIARRRNAFAYELDITWESGVRTRTADPYAFAPLIADADLHYLHEATHRRPYLVLGAHPLEQPYGAAMVQGVRFAVWAPNASRVSVVGDFNQWDGRRHPMRSRGASGVWELFVPLVRVGDRYKFEVRDRAGRVLPLKADPCARAAELRPGSASVVAPAWRAWEFPAERATRNLRDQPVSIYEVHLPSWRRFGDAGFPDWTSLAATLPHYAADLGFTHVELLPITEHPFDASWGYQTLGLHAPSARFGAPDGFAQFVKACHGRGLGVLLDWVPAHFPADAHGLARFDGTALYEYEDPREGFHRDWNTLIYNFRRIEVRNFLIGSALYWLDTFGVDGLRVDAVASMLYRDYSRPAGEWIPNERGGRENLEAISLLQQLNTLVGRDAPGAVCVAEESTAFPGVSAPVHAGGLGFHYKWNMGWMNDTLSYMRENPVHRRWHHDKMTFGLVYAFSENFVLPISHDEVVHGKGSMLGKMPGDAWQRFANLRAYYGFMWGHPGKKLLFMGQEFAQDREWNHEAPLPWHLLEDARHAGVQRWVRALNALYAATGALHRKDCEADGFAWLVADDRDQSVFAWLRRDGLGGEIIVAVNFTPVPRHGYRLGVPGGSWRECLNSDDAGFGGSGVGNPLPLASEPVAAQGFARSIVLTLPPLAAVFLEPLTKAAP
ncbi:MAG TPA: 1,4-alpha-glucan branching protein GlgB [Usitatibacteraceae bacterium]|nr:1,4-alpha-glucan branching protein GlgB [Usitatibacteraceae bacterium]